MYLEATTVHLLSDMYSHHCIRKAIAAALSQALPQTRIHKESFCFEIERRILRARWPRLLKKAQLALSLSNECLCRGDFQDGGFIACQPGSKPRTCRVWALEDINIKIFKDI